VKLSFSYLIREATIYSVENISPFVYILFIHQREENPPNKKKWYCCVLWRERDRIQNIQIFVRLTKTSRIKRASKFSSCKNRGPSFSLSLFPHETTALYSFFPFMVCGLPLIPSNKTTLLALLSILIHIIIQHPFFLLSPFSLYSPTQNNYCYCFCFC